MAYSSFGTQWPQIEGRNPVLTHPTILSIAEKHSVAPSDVVLSWVVQEGAVAIPRASTTAHLEENVRLLGARCTADGDRAECLSGLSDVPAAALLDASDVASIRQMHGTNSRR